MEEAEEDRGIGEMAAGAVIGEEGGAEVGEDVEGADVEDHDYSTNVLRP